MGATPGLETLARGFLACLWASVPVAMGGRREAPRDRRETGYDGSARRASRQGRWKAMMWRAVRDAGASDARRLIGAGATQASSSAGGAVAGGSRRAPAAQTMRAAPLRGR